MPKPSCLCEHHMSGVFMRISTVSLVTLLLLAASACSRKEQPAPSTDKHSVANDVGRAAYKLSEETKKAAAKAAQELNKAGKEAQKGWNEAKKDSRAKDK